MDALQFGLPCAMTTAVNPRKPDAEWTFVDLLSDGGI